MFSTLSPCCFTYSYGDGHRSVEVLYNGREGRISLFASFCFALNQSFADDDFTTHDTQIISTLYEQTLQTLSFPFPRVFTSSSATSTTNENSQLSVPRFHLSSALENDPKPGRSGRGSVRSQIARFRRFCMGRNRGVRRSKESRRVSTFLLCRKSTTRCCSRFATPRNTEKSRGKRGAITPPPFHARCFLKALPARGKRRSRV